MRRALSVLCILVMVLGGLGPVMAGDEKSDEPQKVASWTFMVYMGADNNLEAAGIHDINEMEVAGSTDEVNIVVQMDRSDAEDTSNGDWTTTKRFLVQQDDLNGEIASDELMDLGETDMGDPRTLEDFTIWAMETYPAEKFALILWNHGGAFFGVDWDDDPNGTPVQGREDDWLSMPDLSSAFTNITTHMGRKIDLIGFDACLMADFDVLYQIRHYSDYIVASGYVEPGEGWPYDWMLPKLIENPQMTPAELGKVICDDYVDSYIDKQNDPQDSTAQTMAMFDSIKIGELGHELDKLAMVLAMNSDARPLRGRWAQIYWARDQTNSYDFPTSYAPGNQIPIDPGGYCMYDVIDFMDNLVKFVPMNSEIVAQAQATKKVAQQALLYFRATGYQDTVKGANGLTIYFPSGSDTPYSARYDSTAMANETFWDQFLQFFISKTSATETPPSVLIETPKDGDTFRIDRGNIAVSGTAFDYQNDVGKVEYRVDGGDWKVASGSTDWSFVLDTRTLGKGDHVVEVRASDPTESSGAVPIVVKVTAPEKVQEDRLGGESSTNIMVSAIVFIVLVIVGAFLLGRYRRKK